MRLRSSVLNIGRLFLGPLLLTGLGLAEHPPKAASAAVDQFVVARHTFFDFGPPNNYYELYFVHAAGGLTTVERVTLTPAADPCAVPAKVEVAIGAVGSTIPQLLGNRDLCAIREKDLKRERQRNKRQAVFSGANVALEVSCNGAKRDIRADVFDQDWFDKNAKTPENTLWSMQLLDQLEKATGPNVMDKPAFVDGHREAPMQVRMSPAIGDAIGNGDFDQIFGESPDKPSDIYRQSLSAISRPSVRLQTSATPLATPEAIAYPAIARAAHVEGTVTFHFSTERDGHPGTFIFDGGPLMLREAVQRVARDWQFSMTAGQQVHGTVEFKLNCGQTK